MTFFAFFYQQVFLLVCLRLQGISNRYFLIQVTLTEDQIIDMLTCCLQAFSDGCSVKSKLRISHTNFADTRGYCLYLMFKKASLR